MEFNPEQFLDVEMSEPTTKRPPLPPGDYIAMIGEVTAKPWQGKADPSKSGIRYVVPLVIEVPPAIQQQLGLSQSTIQLTDSIMLDLTDGSLDNSPGKNSQLRRYREALNMNKPGDVFSARKMQGQPIKVKIGHEVYQGEPVERIEGVTKAY